jgi:hypothetical protein
MRKVSIRFLFLVFSGFLCLAERVNASTAGAGDGAGSVPVTSGPHFLWANDLNFGLHDISFHKEAFSKALDDTAENIRGFYKSYDKRRGASPPTTHFAEVSIVFRDRTKKTHVHVIEHLFLSGNFSKTLYLTEKRGELKEEVRLWPTFLQDKARGRKFLSLVDCYPDITGEDLRVKPLKGTMKESVRKLIEDFRLRGIEVGEKNMWNPIAHSHSEQAFLSYVLQENIRISAHPESITILISGYHEPCDQCRLALNHLLKDASFKAAFIRKLFPRLSESESIHLNVFYVISDKEPVRQKMHGLDYIDLKGSPSYFIQGRK